MMRRENLLLVRVFIYKKWTRVEQKFCKLKLSYDKAAELGAA